MLDTQFKESLIALEKTISELPRYKRQPCINCEYKLICAGECEKTINKEEKEDAKKRRLKTNQ